MKLTQERLKELLEYDSKTGVFINKIDRGKKVKKGAVAGGLNKEIGYWKIAIDGKYYLAHRLVFLYVDGYFPENGIDHIDRDKLNNKRCNLREVSQTCNMRNQKVRITSKSGITGVNWHKSNKKWVAQIKISKKIYLGFFDDLTDAARARWNAEVEHNFPNCNTTSSAYNYLKEHGYI